MTKSKQKTKNNFMEEQNIFDWYQEQAKRTCPDLGSEKLNLAHMVLGIVSEEAERLVAQDPINDLEEIADGIWYLANYCSMRNLKLRDFMKPHASFKSNLDLLATDDELEFYDELALQEGIMEEVNRWIAYGDLQDLVKKFLAYNKPIDTKKEKEILSLLGGAYIASISTLFINCDLDINSEKDLLKHILVSNIEKLRIRFPEKFSEENALNRNLEAERKVLEVQNN